MIKRINEIEWLENAILSLRQDIAAERGNAARAAERSAECVKGLQTEIAACQGKIIYNTLRVERERATKRR